MNSIAHKNHVLKSFLVAGVAATTLVAGAVPSAASAKAAFGVNIGPDAELRYSAVDFGFQNNNTDATIGLKVTYRGRVLGAGTVTLDAGLTDWKGVFSTRYGRSLKLTGVLAAKVTGYTSFGDGRKHPFSQKLRVNTGTRKWDGTYKATNGLTFKVKDGFGHYLDYGTLAYCTRSATNTNAFYALPFDMLPVIIRPNGSFATKGHIDTGKIVKLTGRISKSHRIAGYASWTWINIFYGGEPGSYDYCATGGHFHGKRTSKNGS